jgi:hypothetical protein
MNKKTKKTDKKGLLRYVPMWSIVLYAVAMLAVLTDIISRVSVGFADFISNTIGRLIRTVFSYATYIFPFSVAEMLLWFSPVILAAVIYIAVRCVGYQSRALSALQQDFSLSWCRFIRFLPSR